MRQAGMNLSFGQPEDGRERNRTNQAGGGTGRSQEAARLERQLRRFVGAAFCVAVPNGPAGLRMALRAAGVKPGDNVICPALGQPGLLQVLEQLGARPVFADVNPNTFNLDPYCLNYVIGKCLRTQVALPKAVIAVDQFGLPCDYPGLEAVCEKHGIPLVEDLTQALGSSCGGKRAGSFGRFAVASLPDTRVPGSVGESGAVFCRTEEDEQELRQLAERYRCQVVEAGDAGEAASWGVDFTVLGEQLREYHKEYDRRQKVAQRYRDQLAGHVKLQLVGEDYSSAYTQLVVGLEDGPVRTRVMEKMAEENIPCTPCFPEALHSKVEQGTWDRVVLTNAERLSGRLLALPMNSYLTNHVVDFICQILLTASAEQD